jgi:hypothetical protein
MSTYTVPQDVEADDKLLGPFTFRQFIYLIIVAFAGIGAWLLGQIFIVLAVIPLPVIIFFGALALPLKKDQPMETYLAAVLSFYLKPKRRLWKADGKDHILTITAPKVVEQDYTKGLSEKEAMQRLSYLSNLTDSGGWAIKGISSSSVNDDVYREAADTVDMLDGSSQVSNQIEQQLAATDQQRHKQAVAMMQHPDAVAAPTTVNTDFTLPLQPSPVPQAPPTVQHFASPVTSSNVPLPTSVKLNPYPEFNQKVIKPLSSQPVAAPQAPPAPVAPPPTQASVPTVPADIINLANNADLTVETIAREAKRIEQKKTKDSEEVFVSLH